MLLMAACLCTSTASAMTLAEAQRAMEAHNPDLIAAALELRGTQGDARTAASRPAPELSLGTSKLSAKHGVGPGPWKDKRADGTVGLGFTWERGGKRALRVRQADALVAVAGLQQLDVRRQQRLALQETYFGLKAAQAQVALAEQNRRASSEQMQAAQHQVATGAMAPVEAGRLAVDDLAVADAAREAMLELADAQAALALLLGREDAQVLRADDAWPQARVLPETGDVALERRVDLRAARAQLQAADAGLALAHSQRHRDVQWGVEAEREPQDINGVTWGISLTIPLGGRERWRGEAQRAEADRDAAALALQQHEREARLQLAQLRRAADMAAKRRLDYEGLHGDAAGKGLQGMELAYRRGAASLTDLLDARRSWREFEAALIQARTDHAIALARWEAAASVDEGETP